MSSEARLELPGVPSDVAHARHFLADTLRNWRVRDEVADTAVLLLSEVVTNAVRYAPGPAEVSVALTSSGETAAGAACGDRSLRVCVLDCGSHKLPDPLLAPPAGAEGGRGLFLLAELARRWGHDAARDDRKRVWFELSAATN